MKNLLSALLVCLLASGLSACGGDDSGQPSDQDPTQDMGQPDAMMDMGTPDATPQDMDDPEDMNPADMNPEDMGQPDAMTDMTADTGPDMDAPDMVEPDMVEPDMIEPDMIEPDMMEMPGVGTPAPPTMAATGEASLVLNAQGQLRLWGRDQSGQVPRFPEHNLTSVVAVAQTSCYLDPTEGDALRCAGAGLGTAPLERLPQGAVQRFALKADGRAGLALMPGGELVEFALEEGELLGVAPDPALRFVDVAYGRNNACAVDTEGAIHCWGSSQTPPSSDQPFVQIALNNVAMCALDRAGQVRCNNGSVALPAGTYTQVRLGHAGANACGITESGQVVCAGSAASITADVPSGAFEEVAVGNGHACARSVDGEYTCWGSNGWGQALVPDVEPDLVGGGGTTCLRYGAALHCLAGEATSAVLTDAVPGNLEDFVEIQTGNLGRESFACGLDAGGGLTCWGSDTDRNGNAGQTAAPAVPMAAFGLGSTSGCGVHREEGTLHCWGPGAPATSGDIPGGGGFVDVSVGGSGACALRGDGGVACWGRVRAPAGSFTQISNTYNGMCGVTTEGQVQCANEAALQSNLPALPEGQVFAQVVTHKSASQACALDAPQGRAWCWHGAINGDDSPVPRTGLRDLSLGSGICAWRADDTLECWSGYTRRSLR